MTPPKPVIWRLASACWGWAASAGYDTDATATAARSVRLQSGFVGDSSMTIAVGRARARAKASVSVWPTNSADTPKRASSSESSFVVPM